MNPITLASGMNILLVCVIPHMVPLVRSDLISVLDQTTTSLSTFLASQLDLSTVPARVALPLRQQLHLPPSFLPAVLLKLPPSQAPPKVRPPPEPPPKTPSESPPVLLAWLPLRNHLMSGLLD